MIPADICREIYKACDVPTRRALYVTCWSIHKAIYTRPTVSWDVIWLVFDSCNLVTMRRLLAASCTMREHIDTQLGGKLEFIGYSGSVSVYMRGYISVTCGTREFSFDIVNGVRIYIENGQTYIHIGGNGESYGIYETKRILRPYLRNYMQKLIGICV